MIYDKQDDYTFPFRFRLDICHLRSRNFSIFFEQQVTSSSHYPIGSADIYTINENSNRVEKFSTQNEKEWRLYRQINGNSVATLIKNDHFSTNSTISTQFRLVNKSCKF